MSKYPKHKFWGAGEADCPTDIKASNGELHTMRCRVCGDGWRDSVDVCFAAVGEYATLGGGRPGDPNGTKKWRVPGMVFMVACGKSREVCGMFDTPEQAHAFVASLEADAAPKVATPPSVEPHPGSASLEAAGDARSVLIEIFEYAVLAKSRGLDPDGKRFTAAREALLAHLATPASQDRALPISGAAGQLGDPEILGSPTGAAKVLDTGFVYDEVSRTHTPTVLVGFPASDYDSRDKFAAALRAASKPGATT